VFRWLPILLVALVFVVAGCGGGGDDSSASGDTTATEMTTEETTTEETTTEETTTDATETDTDATFAWASEDCQNLVKAYIGLSAAIAAASGGQDVSGDIEEFATYVEQVPGEIRADVETIAAAYGEFTDELAKIGLAPGDVPSADQLQALQAASESLGVPEVQAAGERLTAWTDENCQQ
jgi:ABC-type glycerol-3-phosphate transport system substrate-binding protein